MRGLQKLAGVPRLINSDFDQERAFTSGHRHKDRRTAAQTAWRELSAA
jgi:hypothetical protein